MRSSFVPAAMTGGGDECRHARSARKSESSSAKMSRIFTTRRLEHLAVMMNMKRPHPFDKSYSTERKSMLH